jgi:hypothetical protein
MAGAWVGDLKNILFFWEDAVREKGGMNKNRVFRGIIEAHRRNPHLERKNRSAVEEA